MKTAEEWASEPFDNNNSIYLSIQKEDFKELVKQIQLDAYKAGMTEAAEIASYSAMGFEGDHYISAATQVEQAIISSRDRKTSL